MAILVDGTKLKAFTKQVFLSYNMTDLDASACAEGLIQADMRGISSHGVSLIVRYINGIEAGTILPESRPSILRQTPSTANIDGNRGPGQVVGQFATRIAIEKARNTGIGIVTARNSNHFGIAGYYAQTIVDEGFLGISLTNSSPQVVPTFGRDALIGTNPICLAAPAKNERPFLLDMATSVIPRNKLDVYARADNTLPEGWAIDSEGNATTDAMQVIRNIVARKGGGLLPLGGEGESHSGYKGFGLALMVDILCGVLSGGEYADKIQSVINGKTIIATRVCHFFMALNVENFTDLDTFTSSMDDLIIRLKDSRKASGQNRIYVHGEKEYDHYDKCLIEGIPLQEKVFESLQNVAKMRNLSFELKSD